MSYHPPWFDPTVPERNRCVLSALLASAAAEHPRQTFALFDNGEQWTYAELYRSVYRRAAALQQLGVGHGDRVLVWLPNGPEIVLNWFAANVLGACFVPINPAYIGALLAHVIDNSAARLLIAHGALVQHLAAVDLSQLETVVSIGNCDTAELSGVLLTDEAVLNSAVAVPDISSLAVAAVAAEPALAWPAFTAVDDLMPEDLQSIIYTSGTTGPSKGVLSSYFHLYTAAQVVFGHITSRDRIFVNSPMFHLGGTCSLYAALLKRASVVVVDGFKVDEFWPRIRASGATVTSGLLGSVAPLLASHSAAQHDNNPLRITHFYPVSDATIDLAERFGFDYFSGFGMTELPLPLVTEINTRVRGSCGRPRSGVEVRLVDDNDCDVACGQVGELIARSAQPSAMMSGYNNMPGATSEAMRNGWFHTGDLFRRDEHGNFFFVDRLKDAIRRRGENISSQEVENVVYGFAAVADAAAIGVPSSFGEDDVLIVVSPKHGHPLEARALFDYLSGRLAHFMLPRYIRIVADLPKTPTGKVQKALLKRQGIGADTWDREAEGIVVRRADLQQ